ncbi:L7Ae/L30e/S12e/Gadd45 family ribosomal protein [Marinilactibacillus sp. GCM10026970]|uniref:L7Ae/L30e/S12e/Gadd45 family ribosomal protein n=1 Tax=Marinilactibacillus sp. GCM10026970 TaxID=3252642 RepID=UPI003607B873
MDNVQKSLNLLGLAQRSGNLISGEAIVLNAVRSRQAKIVILASDASENTKKQFLNKCEHYSIPVREDFDRNAISSAIGKIRTVAAITDGGFARSLQKLQ